MGRHDGRRKLLEEGRLYTAHTLVAVGDSSYLQPMLREFVPQYHLYICCFGKDAPGRASAACTPLQRSPKIPVFSD